MQVPPATTEEADRNKKLKKKYKHTTTKTCIA